MAPLQRLRLLVGSSLGRSLFSVGSGAGISRLLLFLTSAYAARVLGREAYGLLSFGTAVAAYATILVAPGLLVWGARAIAREPRRAGHYLLLINGMQTALGLLAYVLLWAGAQHVLSPDEARMVRVAGVGVLAVALSADWVGQGLERFRYLGLVQIEAALLTLAGTLLFVRTSADVYRLPLVMALSQTVAAFTLLALLHRDRLLRLESGSASEALTILRQALPLGVSGAMITLLHYATHVILQVAWGAAALGLFTAAYRMVETLTMVPGLVAAVFLPRLTRAFRDDPVRARGEIRLFARLIMALALLPAALYALEAPAIIAFVYGADFAPAAPILRVLSVAVVFNFAAVLHINGLLALGRDRVYFGSILASLVAAIFGGLLLVPRLGLAGATGVIASLDLIVWLVTLPTFRREIGTLLLGAWVRPLAAAAAMTALLLAAQRLGLPFWLRLPAGGIVYLAVMAPLALGYAQENAAAVPIDPAAT